MNSISPMWQRFLGLVSPCLQPVGKRGNRRRYHRLHLERLENRLAPASHDTLGSAIALRFDTNQQSQVAGMLADANQVDLYAVQLQSGDLLTAEVQAYTPSNPLNSGLRVFD